MKLDTVIIVLGVVSITLLSLAVYSTDHKDSFIAELKSCGKIDKSLSENYNVAINKCREQVLLKYKFVSE